MSWFTRTNKTIDDDHMRDANFYIYFSKADKQKAESLEKELIAMDFKTDLHWLEHEDGLWSLTLNKQVTGLDEIYQLEESLTRLSTEHGGDYDGHEIEA